MPASSRFGRLTITGRWGLGAAVHVGQWLAARCATARDAKSYEIRGNFVGMASQESSTIREYLEKLMWFRSHMRSQGCGVVYTDPVTTVLQ